MAVRSREIGWSNSDILKWELTKEVERVGKIASKSNTTTTSTTTTAPSDVRLKTSISSTGNKIGVLNEYTWKWNSTAIKLGLSHFPTKGVLAQDALKHYPEAISIGEDGFYRVDYSKLN